MIEADTHELKQLTVAMIEAGPATVAKILPIMNKSALNIKKDMQADVLTHPHFKQLAPTITYDVKVHSFAGDASIEAEVGYDKDRGPAAALAGIAIFGSSRPGGGTVRNPEEALKDEALMTEVWIDALMDGLL